MLPAEDKEVDGKPGNTNREQQIPFGRHSHHAENQQIQNAAVGIADGHSQQDHITISARPDDDMEGVKRGAINRNRNSIGSEIPVTTETSTPESSNLIMTGRFSGRAGAVDGVKATAGKPKIRSA